MADSKNLTAEHSQQVSTRPMPPNYESIIADYLDTDVTVLEKDHGTTPQGTNITVLLVETDRAFPYKIVHMRGDEILDTGVNIETRDEADDIYEDLLTQIETDQYSEARDYFENRGFKFISTDKQHGGGLKIEKDGYRFVVPHRIIVHDNYHYIHRHWDDVITPVADQYIDRDSAFYSMIQNSIKDRIPYAKDESRGTVFSTVTAILEANGVHTHS